MTRSTHPRSASWRGVVAFAACLAAAGCAKDPQAAKQPYVASGDQYLSEGKLAEAIIEYRNATRQDPVAGDVRAKLADAYLKNGEPALAVEEYVRAADLLPLDSTVQLQAGNLLLLARRFDDARVRAERVLANAPESYEAQVLLANCLAGLQDMPAAVVELEEAIRLHPERDEGYINLGAFELTRGRREAAEAAFKRAVELSGKATSARMALANFYWMDARWGPAEQELRRVVEAEPSNTLAHRALANFYVATNRSREAEPHLRKVLDLTGTTPAALALADFYIERNETAAARAILAPLEGAVASDAQAGIRLSALDYATGSSASAYERLERILKADQFNLDALLTKSQLLAEDGRLEEALSVAMIATDKHAGSAPAQFNLGRVQAARRQTEAAITAYAAALAINPRATGVKVALAELHLSAGRPQTSVSLAQEVTASDPESARARLTTVSALLVQRDLARAQSQLKVLASEFPDSPPVHVQLGMLRGLQNDAAGAWRHFEEALRLDPDSIEGVGGMVALDLAGKRVADAKARVDARLLRSPKDPPLLRLAARVHAAAGDAPKTEQMLRAAIAASPASLEAYGALAQFYVSQKRLDEALAEFEVLASRDARPVAALTFAGIILDAQGKTSAAREKYERALRVDPEAPVAANNLAWILAETGGNLDTALQLARMAQAKLPKAPEVSDTLGAVHSKRGSWPEAVEAMKTAVALDPASATYHYRLGRAYASAGDNQNAVQHLRRALTINPDFADAAEAKALLGTLAGSQHLIRRKLQAD